MSISLIILLWACGSLATMSAAARAVPAQIEDAETLIGILFLWPLVYAGWILRILGLRRRKP